MNPTFEYEDLYGSKFMSATDLQTTISAVVEDVGQQEFSKQGEKPKAKGVFFFKDIRKPMILNKTNAAMMAELFGKQPANWIGKKVELRKEMVNFGGKFVAAVRVHPTASATAATAADLNGEIPF